MSKPVNLFYNLGARGFVLSGGGVVAIIGAVWWGRGFYDTKIYPPQTEIVSKLDEISHKLDADSSDGVSKAQLHQTLKQLEADNQNVSRDDGSSGLIVRGAHNNSLLSPVNMTSQ